MSALTQAELLAADIDAATRYATPLTSYAALTAAIRSGAYQPRIEFWAEATAEMRAARRHLANRLSSDRLPCWKGSKGAAS